MHDAIGQIVEVHWVDIVQKTVHHCGNVPMAACVSYGELDNVDDASLTIIMEKSDDDYTKQVFPMGCVMCVSILHRGNDGGGERETQTDKPS